MKTRYSFHYVRKLFTIILCLYAHFLVVAQNNVGIGTITPNPTAKLDISDSTKGLLIPRMSITQRNTIPNPAKGLLVFVNNDNNFYYFDGLTWLPIISGFLPSGWLLSGNGGTNPFTNFIGTTDIQPLKFKVNNFTSGFLSPTNFSTGFGYKALLLNTSGYSNVAIGTSALQTNSIGHNLVAVGDSALFNQVADSTDTYSNTAIGSKSLYNNTNGYDNTGVGSGSLLNNNTVLKIQRLGRMH